MKTRHKRAGAIRVLMIGIVLGGAAATCSARSSQSTNSGIVSPPEWSEPIAPFRIAGPIYYVGTRGIAVYAVLSRDGAILIGGPLASDAPLIERSLKTIGVRPGQVKLLLNTHAHFDHAGGLAQLRRDSGARLLASAGDARALELGRHQGDTSYARGTFPPVKTDGIIRDLQVVRLGDIALTATLTPGHTPGCTTWSMPVREEGRTFLAVFPCSISVAGNVLVGNRDYPGIVAAYRRSFARLDAMHADIVLPNHPELADILGRHARQVAGKRDAFVDPAALHAIVASARRDFEAALSAQRKAADDK